jgi:hypothetical protein
VKDLAVDPIEDTDVVKSRSFRVSAGVVF